jgi:hypothetical protein
MTSGPWFEPHYATNKTYPPVTVDEEIKEIARELVARFEKVYREEYIQEATAKEPDCMLAVVSRLRVLVRRTE